MTIGYDWTPDAKRKYVANSIPAKTWKTQSGASILRTLQEQGIGIREKTFYDMRREILDLEKYEEQIRGLHPDTRVPRAWLSAATYWDIKSNFLYRFDVSGVDPNTGKRETRYFSYGSNEELTIEEASLKMLGMIQGAEEFYNIAPDEVELYHTFMKKGYEFTP